MEPDTVGDSRVGDPAGCRWRRVEWSAIILAGVTTVMIALTHAARVFDWGGTQTGSSTAGMIFLFSAPSVQAFWMKNTPLPLDMIFIGSDRKIVGIVEQTVPFSLDSRSVGRPSQFVLEINGGLAKRHGIKAGDAVRFEGIAPESVKE